MHKATRGAEKMLEALLKRVTKLITDGETARTGLPDKHPLTLYFAKGGNKLENYLALDDTTIWGSLSLMERSEDEIIADLAERLRIRRLYKCLDIGALAERIGSDVKGKFQRMLSKALDDGDFAEATILQDRAPLRSAYEFRDYESSDALKKVTIRLPDGSGRHEDVANLSPVIKALSKEKLFRVYARDDDVMAKLREMWEEAKKC